MPYRADMAGGRGDLGDRAPSRLSREGTTTVRLPRSMAAIGDSITQGYGADPTTITPATHLSWATGDHPDDPIGSHYERLRDAGADIEGRAFNFAAAGTRMADAPDQARLAVAAEVDYVTLLMGANDICVWSKAWMTPVQKFEAQFRETIEILVEGLPDVTIYVLSIPDLYRVWSMLHKDPVVTAAWGVFRPCRSMFAKLNTENDRRKVRDRIVNFNQTLEKVAAEHSQCLFDKHAIYERAYIADHVGSDFFHPSLVGQRSLAEVSWRNGVWPEL